MRVIGIVMGALAVGGWAYLAANGAGVYPGDKWTYVFFSGAFLTLLVSGFARFLSFTYAFLATFLWLGFWLKATTLLLTEWMPYEPIGRFGGSGTEWDEVLVVAAVGALGLVAGRVVWGSLPQSSKGRDVTSKGVAPGWYPAWRTWLWVAIWAAIAASVLVNESYGLLRSGHAPGTVLPWPLHGLYGWLISVGLSLGVAALVWWDYQHGYRSRMGVLAVATEAFLVSVSTFSRGLYLLHALPYLALGLRYPASVRGWGWKWILAVGSLGMALAATSMVATNYLRYFGSSPLVVGDSSGQRMPLGQSTGFTPWLVGFLPRLALDRWPGLEGLMAVSAYPGKGADLIQRAAGERRTADRADFFTSEVSLSGFTDADTEKHQYATVPGPVAFLYYSGSLWLVGGGLAALAILLLASEQFVRWSTGNPVIVAVFGVYAAFLFVQLGTGLVQAATTLAFTLGVAGSLGLVQRLGSDMGGMEGQE